MIYFDNAATTRALPEVAEKMTYMLCENFGNPASVSVMGLEVEKEIRKAAEILANGIRAKEEEIFFTSGGTEGDNWAIYGTAEGYARNGKHLITTAIEHPAVKNPMKHLEEKGYEVTWLGVDEKGHISLEELANAIILQAVKDYWLTDDERELQEIERFLRSGWFGVLSKVDPEFLIKELRKEKRNDR